MKELEKKILYFIQLPPPLHGVSKINKQVYESFLINNGLKKDILEIRFSNKIEDLRKFSIAKTFQLFSLLARLISKLQTFKPDYVYFSIMPVGMGFIRDVLFVSIIKFFNIKIIYHIHNQGVSKRFNCMINRVVYRYVFNDSIIIHLSMNMLNKNFSPLNLDKTIHYIVPNGIPISIHKYVKKNVAEVEFKFLFLSHINRNKGLEVLLNAFKLLINYVPNSKLIIAGEFYRKKYKAKINREIIKLNLVEKIQLIGGVNQAEKNKLLESVDIFIFPSLNDICGLVVLEAMQAELPVIITNAGVWPEYAEHLKNALIVEKGNVYDLFHTMMKLINNQSMRQMLGKNAKQLAYKFSLAQFEERMSLVFKEVFASDTK